jgi:hypothetical protein
MRECSSLSGATVGEKGSAHGHLKCVGKIARELKHGLIGMGRIHHAQADGGLVQPDEGGADGLKSSAMEREADGHGRGGARSRARGG